MFPPGAHIEHPNGLRLTAFDVGQRVLEERTFFSIGGGFIVEDAAGDSRVTRRRIGISDRPIAVSLS